MPYCINLWPTASTVFPTLLPLCHPQNASHTGTSVRPTSSAAAVAHGLSAASRPPALPIRHVVAERSYGRPAGPQLLESAACMSKRQATTTASTGPPVGSEGVRPRRWAAWHCFLLGRGDAVTANTMMASIAGKRCVAVKEASRPAAGGW